MFEKDDVNRNSIIPWRAQLIRLLHPGVIGVWSLSHLVFQPCWDSLNVTLVGCDTSSIKLNNILGWTQGSLCLRQCFQELLVELCWLSPLPEAEVWWVWALRFLRQELPDCLPQCLDREVEWTEGKERLLCQYLIVMRHAKQTSRSVGSRNICETLFELISNWFYISSRETNTVESIWRCFLEKSSVSILFQMKSFMHFIPFEVFLTCFCFAVLICHSAFHSRQNMKHGKTWNNFYGFHEVLILYSILLDNAMHRLDSYSIPYENRVVLCRAMHRLDAYPILQKNRIVLCAVLLLLLLLQPELYKQVASITGQPESHFWSCDSF